MIKFILKLFFTLFIIAIIFFAAFFYEIFSSGQKVFSSDEKNTSIIKQLSEMVFSPIEKLKGEDDGRINILLLGVGGEGHYGGELTDTIMIASVNTKTNEAALLSIPRDLYVQIPETNINNKINAIKFYGDQSKEKNGIELLKKIVEEISGLDVHYYAQLDFNGFIKVIDALGGIDVYLEKDINDPSYPNFNRGYDPFYIKKGWHLLDGATALKVARSRHSTMGDFDRIKRQQDIIKATKQKVFEKYSQLDIIAFKNIFISLSDNLKTDLQLRELPRFYKIAKEIKNYDITVETVDTRRYLNRTYIGRGYTLQVKENDYEKINELSANIFNFKISDERKGIIKNEGANIEIRNGTGTLDLANKVSFDLEEFGYRIINSTNIDPPDFSGVQIYDNSEDLKPDTLDFLKEKFNAVIINVLEDDFSKADFIIVLGKGF
ncbi:LCP family protein [Candidatus Parcubacteria bacterium]|nr:LCP family protein [Candidatus Parcubacteria bacterium]